MTTFLADPHVAMDQASVTSLSPEPCAAASCRAHCMAAPTVDSDTRCSTPHLVRLSDEFSSPATVWSDGDRERPPTDGLVHGAVAAVSATLFVDPRRPPNKDRSEETVRQTLMALSDGGLLSGHVLVCAVSLILRAAEANPRTVSLLTIRRLLVAAATLANKAEADEVFALSHFVAATGLSADLLKATEYQLFERLGFDVSTSAPQFHRALDTIATQLPDAEAVEIL